MEVRSIKFGPEILDASLNVGTLALTSSFVTWVVIGISLGCATYCGQRYTTVFRSMSSKLVFIFSCFVSAIISILVNFVPDDIFAHFRVVENLIQNGQYVFNKGEFVEGTATPFWHVLLFVISKLDFDYILAARLIGIGIVPWLVLIQMSISQHLVSGLETKYRDGIRWAPLVFALNPICLIYAGSGMETLLYSFCACLFILCFLKQKLFMSLLLSTIVIGLRFDGFLLVFVVSLFAYIFNFLKWSMFKNATETLFVAVLSFGIISALRYFYFDEVIPHVVKMKTLGAEKELAGLSYLISFIFTFFLSGAFLLFALYSQAKERFRVYTGHLFLIAISIILISSVTFGGGDWMPGSRYLIVPSTLLLCATVSLLGVIGKRKFEKIKLSIIVPVLCIVPLATLFVPPPTPFRNGYLSLQAPAAFVMLLKKDAQKLMTLGRVISYLNNEKILSVESVYTRWIGFIPYEVGSGIRIIDELAYFHRWTPKELEHSIRTNKVGHLIETPTRIETERPSVITNVSSVRSLPYLSDGHSGGFRTFAEKLAINKSISQRLRKFINDNYDIMQIYDLDGEMQFELLVLKDSILK